MYINTITKELVLRPSSEYDVRLTELPPIDREGFTYDIIGGEEKDGEYFAIYMERPLTQLEIDNMNRQYVPQTITPRQIRQQLTKIGLRQQVEEYVSGSADYNLKDWWEYSTSFERENEILINASNALGITEDVLDEIFIEASKL